MITTRLIMNNKKFKVLLLIAIVFTLQTGVLIGCASNAEKFDARATSLNKNPRADAYYNLGASKINENDIQGAFVNLKHALDIDPNHLEALNLIGLIYLHLKDYENAKTSFLKAIEVNGNFAEAHNNLGITYAQLSMWQESVDAFKNTIKNPFYKTPDLAFNNLGFSYYRMGMFNESTNSFKEAIKRSPAGYVPYYGLALVFNAQEMFQQAFDSLDRAIKLDPNFKGDYKKAEAYFKDKLYSTTDHENADYVNYLEIIKY